MLRPGNRLIFICTVPNQSYFYHSKKERNALIILLIFCFLFAAAPQLYVRIQVAKVEYLRFPEVQEWIKMPTERKYHYAGRNDEKTEPVLLKHEKFFFDPNVVSQIDLQRLGLTEKQAATLINYRHKGGKFKNAADLGKIWGISALLVDELIPLVRIKPGMDELPYGGRERNWMPVQKKLININTADSLEFLALPGIGPGFTSRILKFRRRLGGFYAVNQLLEVYGMPDSVFRIIQPRLTCDSNQVIKINVNSASTDDLGHHPYIRYPLAKLIIAYRSQHGNFADIRELQKMMTMNDSLYQHIKRYMTVE